MTNKIFYSIALYSTMEQTSWFEGAWKLCCLRGEMISPTPKPQFPWCLDFLLFPLRPVYICYTNCWHKDQHTWTFLLDDTTHDPAYICYTNCWHKDQNTWTFLLDDTTHDTASPCFKPYNRIKSFYLNKIWFNVYVNVPNLMSLSIDLFYQLSISTCFGHSLPIFRSEFPAYSAVGITNIYWIVRCVVQ
jgi:hypothetical protein